MLTEQDKYWINLNDDLHFFADGRRFLWASERSGFRHLYLYDVSGKQIAQLTRGDWEIEDGAMLDEQAQTVYFTSTKNSPIERQLYSVALTGAEPVELTHDHGTHEVSMAPDGRHFLDTYSTAIKPPQQRLYNADGSLVATLEENKVAELEKYHLQPIEFFTVPGGGWHAFGRGDDQTSGIRPSPQISGHCASLWRAPRAGGAGRVAGFRPFVA